MTADQPPAVTALSCANDSRTMADQSRCSTGSIQRSKAILKTAMPASAVRLAAGSSTPRRAQGLGHRGGKRCELDQFALLKLGVGVDDV